MLLCTTSTTPNWSSSLLPKVHHCLFRIWFNLPIHKITNWARDTAFKVVEAFVPSWTSSTSFPFPSTSRPPPLFQPAESTLWGSPQDLTPTPSNPSNPTTSLHLYNSYQSLHNPHRRWRSNNVYKIKQSTSIYKPSSLFPTTDVVTSVSSCTRNSWCTFPGTNKDSRKSSTISTLTYTPGSASVRSLLTLFSHPRCGCCRWRTPLLMYLESGNEWQTEKTVTSWSTYRSTSTTFCSAAGLRVNASYDQLVGGMGAENPGEVNWVPRFVPKLDGCIIDSHHQLGDSRSLLGCQHAEGGRGLALQLATRLQAHDNFTTTDGSSVQLLPHSSILLSGYKLSLDPLEMAFPSTSELQDLSC